MAVTVIGENAHNNLRHHLLQFFQELSRIVRTLFYFTQLLFPYTRQFGRLQQFLMDNLDELHTGRSGYQVLFLLTDIVTLEKCFDNGGPGGRTADSVLFQSIAQFIVIHQFTGSFHSTQQGGLGVRTWRLRPLLIQIRQMRTALSYHKRRKYILLFPTLLIFFFLRLSRGSTKDHTPAGLQYLLSRNLKLNLLHLTYDGGRCKQAVRIEDSNETACNQVEHAALHIRQILRWLPGRDNGMVIRHFRIVEHLL